MSSTDPSPGSGRAAVVAPGWTLLSNHAHVLIALASASDRRLREIAQRVGITERAVQNILTDLEREGLVTRDREGRRNRYVLHLDRPLRHPLGAHRTVRQLVELLAEERPR